MNEFLAELFEQAKQARGRAHAPYSRFQVGAALRAASGAVYSGANVENAAYPLGVCAETSAIAAMVAGGDREILEMLVLGPKRIAPCGACRQRMSEFAKGSMLVYLADASGACSRHSLSELLPHAFGPEDLNGNADVE
ncbi:cytidine deaminase [Rhodoblastus acidophilus]|uniref:cytidine deaminase n=1 Tax=Rhodoblastus acidophilus TaxID=1074 RepID=UPI0022257C8E|nr:cytidine deaminase [Rhodoblastus acidophilus]MCW2285499.1 cytidine deaminase [Rhodoblastus acidophilus]MCW2334417.1 cytidine deaminase [Rhodoblastus acidophilus]